MKLEAIEGDFVLTAPDCHYNENEELIYNSDNPIYFSSSAGEGKAKYWTEQLTEAFVFKDFDSAIKMRDETNRSYSPVTIMRLVTE
ncbi:hypothetical protein [Vibrio crassostreae]|uniref:hypothetical protein n=1 Tax=Vibrio crassostreae TaxID=246167 RepID=UPI001B301E46|nr:hypothetical protein [Vibrio crassostreae]